MELTAQQKAVVEHVRDYPDQPLVVDAKAGSGKTTACVEAVFAAKDPTTLMCAFNKRNAQDLTERINQRKRPPRRMLIAETLHSIGLTIIRGHRSVGVDPETTDRLVRAVVPSGRSREIRQAVTKTVKFLKETCTPYDTLLNLLWLIAELGYADNLDDVDRAIVAQHVQEVMDASIEWADTVDFCDMIWRPHAHNLAAKARYKLVVVDECQDLSLGQVYIAERVVAPGGRLVAVGDPYQRCYSWRGADKAVWKRLSKNAVTLPLTWSFRCAKAIVREANRIVEDIEPTPWAGEGIVDEMSIGHSIAAMRPGDYFLSRTNAGAVSAGIRASLENISVAVLGGFEVLDPLIELLKKFNLTSYGKFTQDLSNWYYKEIEKPDLSQATLDRLLDRYMTLNEVSRFVEPHRIASTLRAVFRAPEEPAVLFSTVHKAKGTEADRVFVLRDSFPQYHHSQLNPKPGKAPKEIDPEEYRLEYVAITRARDHLTWVNS